MISARLFLIIRFKNDDILPDFFNLISDSFGKYDYFTQNIKVSFKQGNDTLGKLRAFSFKKHVNPLKMRKVLKKTENISRKLSLKGFNNFNILTGYSNQDEVVIVKNSYQSGFLLIDTNLYGAVQLVKQKNSWHEFDLTLEEFKIFEVKNFFMDITRIYKG